MKTTILIIAIWIIGGVINETAFMLTMLDRQTERRVAEAKVQLELQFDRERSIAARNLWQAERFAVMCLDPSIKYAYLGDVVVECRAKVKGNLVLPGRKDA